MGGVAVATRGDAGTSRLAAPGARIAASDGFLRYVEGALAVRGSLPLRVPAHHLAAA